MTNEQRVEEEKEIILTVVKEDPTFKPPSFGHNSGTHRLAKGKIVIENHLDEVDIFLRNKIICFGNR